MTERASNIYMMTSRQVRIASLVAIPGLVCRHLPEQLVAELPMTIRFGVALLAAFGGWLVLMWIAITAPGWRGAQPGEFDEREIADRRAGFVTAYYMTGFALLGIGFYGMTVTSYALWEPPPAKVAFALLWSLTWLHLAMPGIVIAWRSKRIDAGIEDED